MSSDQDNEWLAAARRVIQIESAELRRAAERLDERLLEAVHLILESSGKVVVTGIGKSGHVGRKLAATFSSTGTPAVFMHPSEATHGDLGMCMPDDPVIMISNAGSSAELARLVRPLRELGCPLIGIVGSPRSALAADVDVVLDASVEREADPDGLVPTASSVVALAVGHSLAVVLMQARNFTADEFGQRHPGGQIGRNLRATASEAMHRGEEVAWVAPEDSLKLVVIEMTSKPLGAACVVDASQRLIGLITDGDLRRVLRAHDDIRGLRASDVMTANPISIAPAARLLDAMRLMEARPSQISLLPVVDEQTGKCVGLVRLHDICRVWLG